MSTTILTYPTAPCDRQTPAIGPIPILAITSVALIAGAILVIVVAPIWDAYQAARIPVAGISPDSLPIAVGVPTPPAAELHPSPSETPAAVSDVTNEPSVVAVPVPTPPLP
jgi:hypothetical protein